MHEGTGERLYFDKNEFLKDVFSVDEFLHKHRNVPSLELLRDNLGLYLKGLRSSMIDLINEDYEDFVNLSGNLIGLDQSIEQIKMPVENFQSEVSQIQELIRENDQTIKEQLKRKTALQQLKRDLQSLKQVRVGIVDLKQIMLQEDASIKLTELERASLRLVNLKFHRKLCQAYLVEAELREIDDLEKQVFRKMRMEFNAALNVDTNKNNDALERCLRVYVILDACDKAEEAFREDVVAPYMEKTISESSLQNNPQGLAGIYSKILDFVSLKMTNVLFLTQYTEKLKGFNFLVNSFWADVSMRLETYMTSIFAVGNSSFFHRNYNCTKDFVNKIELLLTNEKDIRAFRESKYTKGFNSRWNLPVYFQISFQEIAGDFERSLDPNTKSHVLESSSGSYQLTPFNQAHLALERCWSDGIFLQEVFPKFLKLNIQIILRLLRWVSDMLKDLFASKENTSKPTNRNEMLVALYCDTKKLLAYIPQLSELVSSKACLKDQKNCVSEMITKSFQDLQNLLGQHLGNMRQCFFEMLIAEIGSETIRQVSDLPRLYRKTNKEIPSKASPYVDQMVKPLSNFVDKQKSHLGEETVKDVLLKVSTEITQRFFQAVCEVLTSVQKTEESLRRLRNLKNANTSQFSNINAVSDDDKIRLQLRVDVTTWERELNNYGFTSIDIPTLSELTKTVEDSIKAVESN